MRINRLLPLLAVWLCLTTHAVAAESRIIAVLPFDVRQASGKMDESSRVFLEEAVRDSAIKLLSAEGWTVLSGETTLQVLLDNGVDAQKCGDQTCHLSMAREIKAEKFISGSVQFVEGKFSAFVRMIESKTGKIIASERLMGGTVTSLQEQFEAKAATFFQVIRATTTVVTSAGEVAAKSVPAALPSESRTTPAKTMKGWIGLGMRDSELTLKQRALVGRARAPTLTWPVPGGPAEKANLQWDDILVSINSKSYETAADAAAAIEAIGPDQEISLGYLRGDEVFSVSLKTEIPLEERAIGEREKDVRTLEALLGIRVLAVPVESKYYSRLNNRKMLGLLILKAPPEKDQKSKRWGTIVSSGDWIYNADMRIVNSFQELYDIIMNKRPGDSVMIDTVGRFGTRGVYMRIGEE